MLLVFIGGLLLGALLVFLATMTNRNRIRRDFNELSHKVVNEASDHLLRLASVSSERQNAFGLAQMEHKKELINQTLNEMRGKLERVELSLNDFNEKREVSFAALSTQLRQVNTQTERLGDTTSKLKEVLSSSKSRGQWGERMADDVLRLCGLHEGINYYKNKTQDSITTRPDFTFILPRDLLLNMDVKFPFDNYLKYQECQDTVLQENFKKVFLKDVRNRLKEVTGREYINPAENTVDYVLIFIPSEQIYSFINENDHLLIDDALRMKIIICSPQTLYAVLAVVRQAVDNFKISERLGEVLSLIDEFKNQWRKYCEKMDVLGRRLDDARREYEEIQGVRSRGLDRSISKIENAKGNYFLLEKDEDLV